MSEYFFFIKIFIRMAKLGVLDSFLMKLPAASRGVSGYGRN